MSGEWLWKKYSQLEWYDAYNFLEFIVEYAQIITQRSWSPQNFTEAFNKILESESSGYRFIKGQLVPISTEAEIQAIQEVLSTSERVGLESVRTHLAASLTLFGRRPQPDYRNTIKEAISAVESAVKCIIGTSGGGLENALKDLSHKTPLHPALMGAFLKLYGYTSDEDGIRHAILDAPTIGFDEAKFMLVACSAFVNFLISKAEAVSLL